MFMLRAGEDHHSRAAIEGPPAHPSRHGVHRFGHHAQQVTCPLPSSQRRRAAVGTYVSRFDSVWCGMRSCAPVSLDTLSSQRCRAADQVSDFHACCLASSSQPDVEPEAAPGYVRSPYVFGIHVDEIATNGKGRSRHCGGVQQADQQRCAYVQGAARLDGGMARRRPVAWQLAQRRNLSERPIVFAAHSGGLPSDRQSALMKPRSSPHSPPLDELNSESAAQCRVGMGCPVTAAADSAQKLWLSAQSTDADAGLLQTFQQQ